MINVSVLTIMLLQFLHMLVEVSGQSDCSQYFTYITESNSENDIWGQVLIPSPPKNVELRLRVVLSIAVRLSNRSYVGQIGLRQSKEDSIQAVQQGRPLLYQIRFPLTQPIPIISGIWFNNQLYCTGSHAEGPIITSFALEHSLHPSSHLEPDFTAQQGANPMKNVHPSPESNDECGRSFTNITINQLISTKMKISPGEWPWLVAIFHVRETIEFKCSGTLLTNRHVLAVGICLKNMTGSYQNIPPAQILASLGLYRLTDWQERGSVNKLIKNYTIHPDFQGQNNDANLAILVLSTPVAYSSNIKPICLWSGPSDLQRVVGKSGYVVGWGINDLRNGYFTLEPRMSRAPIVSQEDCLRNDYSFNSLISNRTLCAGLTFGSGPCNGDSGSGLMLYNTTTGRYKLRGVVLKTILNATTFSCIAEKYVLYIDVAKHMDWINQQISMK